jgi:hypothetical protein
LWEKKKDPKRGPKEKNKLGKKIMNPKKEPRRKKFKLTK